MSFNPYANGYKFRRLITVDNTKVSGGDHTDFPMLFSRTVEFLKATKSGGKVDYPNNIPDIRFETTGGTQLDHEIETYDPGTGQMIAWIEIDSLLAASDTTIYIYYGNSTITASEENIGGTWNSGYEMVFHMSDDPDNDTNIKDSTSNGRDGTKRATGGPAEITGQINKAQVFNDSVGDKVTLDYVNLGSALTYECWFLTNTASSSNLMSFMDTLIRVAPAEIAYWADVDLSAVTADPSINTGEWHHLVIAQSGTAYRIMIDGSTIGTGTTNSIDTANNNNFIAQFASGLFLDGNVDEFRISGVARAINWRVTDFNVQNDNESFFTIGAEEVQQVSLVNQYAGATHFIPGATVLDTKAIINIKEGYQIGATNEFVDIGEFEVTELTNKGPFNQELQVRANSLPSRLESNRPAIERSLDNHYSFFDNFINSNTLSQNWTIEEGSWGISQQTLITFNEDNPQSAIWNTTERNLDNMVLTAKFKMSVVGQNHETLIAFSAQKAQITDDGSFYLRALWNGSTVVLDRVVDGSITLLEIGPASTGLSANTFAYLRLLKYHDQIEVQTSADGKDFTTDLSYTNTTDDPQDGGYIGFHNFGGGAGGGTKTFVYDNLEITEIGSQFSKEDVLRTTLGMGRVDNLNVENELDSFSLFESTAGSSWVRGTTLGFEQVDLQNTIVGNSWHMLTTTGGTFQDFIFECEFRGTSGNKAGIMVGSTQNFYAQFNDFNLGSTGSFVDHYRLSAARSTFTGKGNHLKFQPDTWYNFKVVKKGLNLEWYINDLLSNSISGLSLINNPEGVSNLIGLVGFRSGVSGQTTSFRKPKVSRLNVLVNDIHISANSPLSSTFDRYLPEGFATNWRTDTLDLFTIGASRGQHGVTQYTSASNQFTSNTQGDRFVEVNSTKFSSRVENDNLRVTRQIDSTRVSYINDQNLQSSGDGLGSARTNIKLKNKAIEDVSLSLNSRVNLETYDKVNLVDINLGISKQLTVYSQKREFDTQRGSFRQSLQLA